MIRHGYCLKKGEIIPDRKLADYCLVAGNFKAICKNLAIQENNGRINIIKPKLLAEKV